MNRTDIDIKFLMKLDEICDEYESQVAGGAQPNIGEFLDRVPEEHRSALVYQLVKREVTLCGNQGERITADDLLNRYSRYFPSSEGRETLRRTLQKVFDSTKISKPPAAAGDAGRAESADTLEFRADSAANPPQAQGSAATAEWQPTGEPPEFGAESEVTAAAGARGERWPDVPGYEIRGVLGRGGMGIVYRARQTGLKRVVALKMILAGGNASDELLARFQAEAEAVAHLQHPNIVQVYEVGKHNGLPYFSLEFVEGNSLEGEIDRKPLEPGRAAELVELTARAMDHAHQHHIVHRDLKPANILLTRDGQPKVTDFGLVKRLEGDSSQTRTGNIMGTPSYMAPEQGAEAKDVGPLADVYALGGILYCALTGRPPFLGATAVDTVLQALNDDPLPPSRLQPKTPADLETICLKCLHKEPAKRYASAHELAEDLRRFRAGEPITARPVSRTERCWRWCLRNPRLAAVSATAAALLLLLAVGGPVAAVLINQQRMEAVYAKQSAQASQLLAEQNAAEAERNEEAAEEQRQIAEAQRDLAEGSLRTMVYTVQTRLKGEAGQSELRRELLGVAIEGLEKVIAKNEGYMGRDHLTASAYRKLGAVCLEVGESSGAMRNYRKSLEIVLRLVREGRMGDPDKTLADLYLDLGNAVLAFGEASEAGEQFQLAVDHWQKVRQEQPDDLHALDQLAKTYGRLAAVAAARGDTETQRDYTLRQLELRKQWLDQDPENVDARAQYAGAMKTLSTLSLRMGDPESAQQQAQLALNMLRELMALEPANSAHGANAAMQLLGIGYFQLTRGSAESQETFQEAVDLIEAALTRNPENATLRKQLGEAHYYAGLGFAAAGDQQRSLEHHRQALHIRQQLLAKSPRSPKERCRVMLSNTRCGELKRAAEEASQLRAAHPRNVDVLIHCACAEALLAVAVWGENTLADLPAAQQEQYETHRGRALADIEKVLDSGFSAFFALRTDPDTDGLRKLPGYLDLLDRAEAGGSP